MKEEQAIPELRRLKDMWKKLYEEGKEKDKYERRALLRQMNRIEGDIAKKDLELAKIDRSGHSVSGQDGFDSVKGKGDIQGRVLEQNRGNADFREVDGHHGGGELHSMRSGY